jgi:hypothetical protein
MADPQRRRPAAPKRALIGPLVMLLTGAVASAALWRFLMLEPAPGDGVGERLSSADRRALDDVFRQGTAR